jgi:hypothetical protein
MEPPHLYSEREFHLSDADGHFTQRVLDQTGHVDTRLGSSPVSEEFSKAGSMLAFWAGDVGMAVSAESMMIINQTGEVSLDQVKELHDKWWKYWKQYWKLKDSKAALPYDYACENTIPAERVA